MPPATWMVAPSQRAWTGNSTARVTPWRVRSPGSRSSTTLAPETSPSGTGWRRRKLAVGKRVVSRPSSRMRPSRGSTSVRSRVMSTVTSAPVTAPPAMVTVPLTAGERPTTSLGAEIDPSRSRTR